MFKKTIDIIISDKDNTLLNYKPEEANMLKNLDTIKTLECEINVLFDTDGNAKDLCCASKSIEKLKDYASERDLDETEEIIWVSYPFEIHGYRKGQMCYTIERKFLIV